MPPETIRQGFDSELTTSRIHSPLQVECAVVLGSPRSGTTFLMRALDTLADTACLSGVVFPVGISQIVQRSLPPDVHRALLEEFGLSLREYLNSGLYNARSVALRKWFASRGGTRAFFQALRGQHRPARIVYKEPFLSFSPAFVYHALPQARILHLYRDGRDCADSLQRKYDILTDEKLTDFEHHEMRFGRAYDHRYVPDWVEDRQDEDFIAASPYVRAIWMWKVMVGRNRRLFDRPDVQASGRVLAVCYERLMQDPIGEGRRILEHLNVEPGPRFFRHMRTAHTRSIGVHRRRSAEEIAAAEHVAGDELTHYGYL